MVARQRLECDDLAGRTRLSSAASPSPVMHVDTGKKFAEMYAFRERYAKEWNLDLIVEHCPPIETTDPTLPPAARSAARKTEGLKLALAKHGFDGGHHRHPPRRGTNPRERARVLASRCGRHLGRARPAAGVLESLQRLPRRKARICASIRSCTGRRPTSGPTRAVKTFRLFRCI